MSESRLNGILLSRFLKYLLLKNIVMLKFIDVFLLICVNCLIDSPSGVIVEYEQTILSY